MFSLMNHPMRQLDDSTGVYKLVMAATSHLNAFPTRVVLDVVATIYFRLQRVSVLTQRSRAGSSGAKSLVDARSGS